jgi:hypothetical protein
MGDLHDAVAALLDAFARGISVIRAQRARRKEQQQPVETVQKTAETHLRKSLKKNRAEVREAYGRDLARYGSRFASGDGKSACPAQSGCNGEAFAHVSAAEAQSALSSILFRLNAAFVSVIERFTKGRSTRADYRKCLERPISIGQIYECRPPLRRFGKAFLDQCILLSVLTI